MRKKSLPALIVLNVILLAAVAALWLIPAPEAQAQLGARGNEYVMISGEVNGRNEDVIYILETTSARMAAVMYMSGTDNFTVIDGTNIANDVRGAGARR